MLPPLSPSEARQIVQVCDRFEAAWKAGRRPDPAEYLGAAAGPARSALLRQLLLLDWEYRRRAGDDPRAGDYHPRFPGDTALVEAVGRAMAEPPDSTHVGSDVSHAPDTPWADDRTSDLLGKAGAGADGELARYDLVQEVGQGGIGVVFRGRDQLLGRELAVKVLRADYRDKPDARHRFIAEARVGSQLQHPAIVPVYELGRFGDGRPYFTMKLVEGHTLAALLHGRADPTQDLPRWLGIFEQVCQAVAYAHSKGVIHRDLKPANVMVGAFGEVQVVDWGFAKALAGGDPGDGAGSEIRDPKSEINGVTHSGVLLGTPAYMPPEQARGEAALIDRRADVFALGAMLCEILTGRPPYAGGAADEVCRRAAAGDLGEACARLDACGADEALRDLAKRCLAAGRGARPADAGAVVREVTAHLATAQERLRRAELERVAAEARAQEAGAKAKAERRARRLTLALAAALLFGAAVAAWQAVVATRAKHDALTAAAAQKEARETADAKEAETRAVLDFVQNRILAAARPEGQEGGLGREVTLRRALEAALPAVDKSFAQQPLTEARLRMTLGASFLYLGEAKIAAEQFRRARAIYTEHLGPDHPDTLRSMNNLANSYAALGRHADALQLREQTLAVFKTRLGPGHPDTFKGMNNLANSYDALGRHADALALHEETLARRRARLGPDHPDTLSSMHNLAASYAALGRRADALALYEEALARRRAKLGPDHPDTLLTMNNLANSYAAVGRSADALKLHEETLALQKAKLGPDHPDTLLSMHDLAASYANLGRYADALALYEEALARRRARLGPDHPDTLLTMNSLAMTYGSLGRRADALTLYEEALALRKAKLGPDHPDTLLSMYNLALTYGSLGRSADALKLHEETLALRKAKLGADHPDTFLSMWGVAYDLLKLDRGAEAVPIIDECLRRATGQSAHPTLFPGMIRLRLRHFEKAKDAAGCRTTAELWEKQRRTDAASLYNAACWRAVTAAVIRATDTSPAAAVQADAEADRAMAWLKQAIAAGYNDVANMKKDKDIDALRDRADFQKLMTELEAGG
jgi:tetratricopeptide (TPR) repeat protein